MSLCEILSECVTAQIRDYEREEKNSLKSLLDWKTDKNAHRGQENETADQFIFSENTDLTMMKFAKDQGNVSALKENFSACGSSFRFRLLLFFRSSILYSAKRSYIFWTSGSSLNFQAPGRVFMMTCPRSGRSMFTSITPFSHLTRPLWSFATLWLHLCVTPF